MKNRRNYYRILHVQAGAPVEIIRASYRTLMQRLRAHPDLGGDHGNAALINEAYAVLTDAAKRAEYDRDFQERVVEARNGAKVEPVTSVAASPEPSSLCLFCKSPHALNPTVHADAACGVCGSPLRRVTLKALGSGGKRAINRMSRNHPLRLYTRWPQAQAIAAHSRDISPNGISFVTREELLPRAIVKIDSEIFRAVMQVANVRPIDDKTHDTWLVGAEFLSVIFPRSRGAFLSTEA
jgi:curved DNA-binding protein CbpA